VDVDKAWRDRESTRVNLVCAALGDAPRDRGNSSGADRDVALDAGGSRAIEHRAAAEDEIVWCAAEYEPRRTGEREQRTGGRCDERASSRG
jgi:hypothetical protein